MTENGLKLAAETARPEADETSLVRAARQDSRAFGELYLLYVERVFRYLYSRVGNVQEAEDITAQTFLAALESLDRLRQDAHFTSWLFTIARNKAMDHLRQRKNTVSIDAGMNIPAEADPLRDVIQSEQTAALAQLLQTLPDKEQELLRLRFLAGMSFPEMARVLRRSKDAVKKSTYRLLARLHSQLEVSHE